MKISGGFSDEGFLSELRAISTLDKKGVDIGWFDDTHPTAGMTFAELANFHAVGGTTAKPVIPRNVLELTLAIYPFDSDRGASQALFNWLDDPSKEGDILDYIGKDYVEKIKGLFGSSLLTPTPSNPDPLIDTGALREATSHRKIGGEG